MKLKDVLNFGLLLFIVILAGTILIANILLYPVIVEVSINLTKMIIRALGLS